MLQRYCGNCMYWAPSLFRRGPSGFAVPTEGECRRRAPLPEGWPSTAAGGWCGDWQHASAREARPVRRKLPTQCRNGHTYKTGTFVYTDTGHRKCLLCAAARKDTPKRRKTGTDDQDISIPLPGDGQRLRVVEGTGR